MSKTKIAEQLLATAETMGTELSDVAIEMMVADLAEYPAEEVFTALQKCRREHTGRLTLAAVISRIRSEHLGNEEMWANIKPGWAREDATIVLTKQAEVGLHAALAHEGDAVAARMTFKEVYAKQDFSTPPHWFVSLGWDKAGREGPVLEAVRLGRLTASTAQKQLPKSEQIKLLANRKEVVV